MNKKIAFLQVFGIILVVLGHSEINYGYGKIMHRLIYSFHMPLFIFISGYLYTLSNIVEKVNFLKFVKIKFKRLLIPYLIITSIAYIPKYILSNFALRPIELSFSNYLLSFLYPWDNPIIFFWFLPTLFIILLLTAFLQKIIKGKIILFLVMSFVFSSIGATVINIQLLNINGVIYYWFYFLLGIYYSKNEIKIDKKLKVNMKFTILLLGIILCINALLEYQIENSILKIIIAIVGILFSILLSIIYVQSNCKFLNNLNKKTYIIYLLSWFPQVFLRILILQLLGLKWYYVVIPSFLLGIYLPILVNNFICFICKKNQKLNFLKIIFGIG